MRLIFTTLFLIASLSIAAVPTSDVAVVGRFAKGPVDVAVQVNAVQFDSLFGAEDPASFPAEIQVRQFFRNGGGSLAVVRIDPGLPLDQALPGRFKIPALKGLGALLPLSNLGILICPEMTTLPGPALALCLDRIENLGAYAPLFTVLDPPPSVTTVAEMLAWRQANLPTDLAHAALYFPRLSLDPAQWSGGSSAIRITAGGSGTMAAVIQKNDASRGIWKAPAGADATLITEDFEIDLTTQEVGLLNAAGICSLWDFSSYGPVAWGARTLSEDPEDKFISTGRTRRWIHRSLARELSDAALQENDSPLWVDLKSRAESFLNDLYRGGAFAGFTVQEAYFAKCGTDTTSINDINAHRVNVLIGISMSRPAEFVLENIQLATLDESLPEPDIPLLVSPPFAGKMILSHPTVPGFEHSLLSSGSLATASWSGSGASAGNGAWKRTEIPTVSPREFFRVKDGI